MSKSDHVVNISKPAVKQRLYYMFENKPVDASTWDELVTHSEISEVHISGCIYILINKAEHTYCYVYADEAELFSNPFRTFDEARRACRAYMLHLLNQTENIDKSEDC